MTIEKKTMSQIFTEFFIYCLMILLGMFLIVFLSAVLVVGSGYALSFLFKFSLLEASFLCLGVTFVCAFILFAINSDQSSNMVDQDHLCPVCVSSFEKRSRKQLSKPNTQKYGQASHH
jgi:hypothetical protein